MSEADIQPTSHADGIFDDTAYEAPSPQRKDFLPWHRPRKQFVRQYQWLAQIEQLLKEFPVTDRPLKYLGLPGADLLDLRYLHTAVCEPRDLKLKFLGFVNAANPSDEGQTELNISLDEVRRLSHVDRDSDVIGDDVRGIATDTSIAWKRTRDLGPYDVVNLDLCDGFGRDSPSDRNQKTHYRALNALLSIQAHSKSPWLLLLTTRVGAHDVHADVLKSFLAKYQANLDNCETFKAASRDLFQIEELPLDGPLESKMLPLYLGGLCKWLLNLTIGLQPPWTIEVKSVIGYRVEQGAPHEDLVSLALRFTPVFSLVPDAMGLSHRGQRVIVDECALATKVIRRIAKLANADVILQEKPELKAALVDATAGLLAIARYDPDAYRHWASG